MGQLSTKHLLGIKGITTDDIQLIFETADEFKDVINRPIKKVPSLRDITIANLFFENSTRTRLSFELAEKRLSADVVNFSACVSWAHGGNQLLKPLWMTSFLIVHLFLLIQYNSVSSVLIIWILW